MPSKVLTIRLSQSESEALTRIRATRELATNSRRTIKEILSELISDAYVIFKKDLLSLPIHREVATLEFAGVVERIAFEKSDEEHTSLEEIKLTKALKYGHADLVRELIKRFDQPIKQSKNEPLGRPGI